MSSNWSETPFLIGRGGLRSSVLLVTGHLEAGLVLQEREAGDLPADDHPQPLPLALQEQADHVHGQVSSLFFIKGICIVHFLFEKHKAKAFCDTGSLKNTKI